MGGRVQLRVHSLARMLGHLAQACELGGAEEGTRIALLTGSLTAAQRKQAMLDVVSGTAGTVVGTHALIQDKSSSPTSAWSWSTNNTASASSSETRCAPVYRLAEPTYAFDVLTPLHEWLASQHPAAISSRMAIGGGCRQRGDERREDELRAMGATLRTGRRGSDG